MVYQLLRGRRLNRLFPMGALAAILGLSLLSSQAAALSVGRIQVSSFLNEPFRATVPLSSVQPGEAEQLRIRLADDSAYSALGLEKSGFLNTLKFTVREGRDPDSAEVSISSREVAKEPFFSFLLEFRGLSGRIVREYTVLLDPNTGQRQQARAVTDSVVVQPAPQAPVAESRQVVVSAPAAAVDDGFTSMPELPAEPVVQAPSVPPVTRSAPPAVSRAPVQAFESGSKERRVEIPSPQVFAGSEDVVSAPASAALVEATQPITASKNNQYGPVPAGMTLWQISAAVRPDSSLTMSQVMWGLYSVNEDQFNGNLNALNRGAILRVPSVQAFRNVSPGEAAALVADQAEQHKSPRRAALAQSTQQASADQPRYEPAQAEQLAVEVEAEQAAQSYEAPEAAASYDDAAEDAAGAAELSQNVLEEPVDRPVEVVEAQELPVDDGFEELEALPVDEALGADASEDFADLPALPEDAASDSAAFDEAEAGSGFDAGNESAGGEDGGLLGWLLAALGVVVAAIIALFMFRRRGQSDKSDGVATQAAAQTAAVSDFADDQSDISAPRVVDDVDDASAESADESDFNIPDLDTLAAVDDQAETVADDTADELTAAEVDFGDTEIRQAPVETAAADGPMTLDMPEEAAADDLDGGTQTLDLGSETVSLELNEDPVSEADFQLAYGLYDEAALLLNRAIENDPDRLELHEKLAETYFAASDADNFKNAAQALKAKEPDAETWQRIAIMGQQLCPGDELFSGDLSADVGGAVDLDMAFDSADDQAAPAEEAVASVDFDLPETESPSEAPAAADDNSVVEFELDDEPVAEADTASTVDDFDADFGSLDLAEDAAADELPDLDDLDLGDLDAELEADDEATEAVDFDSDTVVMAAPEIEPAADTAAEPAVDDFDDLTLTDISDTELGLDSETGDAGDVLGVGTDFDLGDTSVGDAADELTELDLDAALELEESADDLAVDDLTLDIGGDDDATAFDLGDFEADASATDFDLGELDADAGTTDSPELSLDDISVDSGDELDLPADATDFNLDDLGVAEDAATDATAFDLNDLDESADAVAGLETGFDLDNPIGEVPLEDTVEETDFDLDDLGATSDLDSSAGADAGDISGGDEAATKLDLARAYVDMGEADMARSLLDEVTQAGNDTQKAEAQELLGKL